MPTVLTSSQQTFVDITDQRKLSAYITSNLPKSQIEDPNVLPHTYAPDWASTPLTLTPVVFLDQTNLALDASGLTISWKRKEGNGAEAALTSGGKRFQRRPDGQCQQVGGSHFWDAHLPLLYQLLRLGDKEYRQHLR